MSSLVLVVQIPLGAIGVFELPELTPAFCATSSGPEIADVITRCKCPVGQFLASICRPVKISVYAYTHTNIFPRKKKVLQHSYVDSDRELNRRWIS